MEKKPVSTEQIARYCVLVQAKLNAWFDQNVPLAKAENRPTIVAEPGQRYCRIVKRRTPTEASCHSFIDMTNGDVLKSASWKAPAKHARGSVHDADGGASACDGFGANSLR